MILLIGLATFFATLCGGFFALYMKDRLHLILGFSAGAVIGVAFFDLMPEAFELASGAYEPSTIASFIAVGFLGYLLLDRFVAFHTHDHDDHHEHTRGALGAGSLSTHSFLDGIAVGLAFQVSASAGIIVTLAVLAHDFSDGINTVNMIMKNNGNRRRAFRWLLVDAVAPTLGILSTLFFTIEEATLGLLLALFTGFFLYIGPSDLLPESHHRHPVAMTTFMTFLGAGVLYLIIQFAGV